MQNFESLQYIYILYMYITTVGQEKDDQTRQVFCRGDLYSRLDSNDSNNRMASRGLYAVFDNRQMFI